MTDEKNSESMPHITSLEFMTLLINCASGNGVSTFHTPMQPRNNNLTPYIEENEEGVKVEYKSNGEPSWVSGNHFKTPHKEMADGLKAIAATIEGAMPEGISTGSKQTEKSASVTHETLNAIINHIGDSDEALDAVLETFFDGILEAKQHTNARG